MSRQLYEFEIATSALAHMNEAKVAHLNATLAKLKDVRFSRRFDLHLGETVWTWTGRLA